MKCSQIMVKRQENFKHPLWHNIFKSFVKGKWTFVGEMAPYYIHNATKLYMAGTSYLATAM